MRKIEKDFNTKAVLDSKEKLNKLVIDNGIKLDGKKIKGVRSYSVTQNESENVAELTLLMDVVII